MYFIRFFYDSMTPYFLRPETFVLTEENTRFLQHYSSIVISNSCYSRFPTMCTLQLYVFTKVYRLLIHLLFIFIGSISFVYCFYLFQVVTSAYLSSNLVISVRWWAS